MKQPFKVRQGDVFIMATHGRPATDAKRTPRDASGRLILQEGEVTGHAHAILDRDVELYSVGDEVDRWLRVGSAGASVVHEEHGTITLPPGTYLVRIQREFTDDMDPRQVAD